MHACLQSTEANNLTALVYAFEQSLMLAHSDRPIHSLDYARQVLKDASDWQKNVISDLERKKRTFRTEELYNVVDAIGQDEAQVEAARVKQLVQEHLLAAEEEVKKMVGEQVQVNAISTNTPVPESKKVTKFSSRLPRVAFLPPKGLKFKNENANLAENQGAGRPTSGTKVLRKRPPQRPRPKTLSELMESRVKPLPRSVLEEFGISANRVLLPGRPKISVEVPTDVQSIDRAIPLAPPTRNRPINVPVEQVIKSSEQGNVALINLTPEEKEIPKLNLQVLPSIDIKGQARLLPKDKRANVKLISVVEPEAEPQEVENEIRDELPGSQLTNLLRPQRRDDHGSGNPVTIQKQALLSHPQTSGDSLQNSLLQGMQNIQAHVIPPNHARTLYLDNGDSRLATQMPLTDPRLLTNGSPRPSYVHPHFLQERLPGGSRTSQPLVGQFPSSSRSSGLTSDNIFGNITSRWTEQELIAKIVQELSRNIGTPRTDNQQQNYFANDELIRQLVLEVIREDLLTRASAAPTSSSNGNGIKTKEASPDPAVTKEPVNLLHKSEESTGGTIAQKNSDSNVPSHVEGDPPEIEVPKRNGHTREVSSNSAQATGDKTNNKNVSILCSGNGKSETIEPAQLKDGNGIASFSNVIPRDISVHVFIEDKRGSERKDDDLGLKKGNETTIVKSTEMRNGSEELVANTKPDLIDAVSSVSRSTDAVVREKANAGGEKRTSDSESAHFELKKEFREIGVNATVEYKKESTSVGTQVEDVPIDLLLSPELNAPSEIVSPISPMKSPLTSSEDEENQRKSVRDVGIQLSGSHTSSSGTTDNTTLTTTTSSEEPISEGELLIKYHQGIVRLPASTLDSTLQSIDEGEMIRTLSDGEIAACLQHPLERVLSVGEIQEGEGSEEMVVAPPLTEPKTKVGKREDRSRQLKLTASSFSEGEMIQKLSSTSSEGSTSTATSPEIG